MDKSHIDRKTSKKQRKTQLRDKDIQLSCMLIGTSFAFLLLCLPAEVNDIFIYIGHEHSCFHWFRKVILMLMQQIYYAGHFYIYTLTGQLFRKHLYATIFTICGYRYVNNRSFPTRMTVKQSNRQIKNGRLKPRNNYFNTTLRRPTITVQETST
jgi:hypothetical protein